MCTPSGCDDSVEVRGKPREGEREGLLLRRERCDGCPLDKLDSAITQDSVLHRAFDLDFALSAGIHITLDQIDVEEFRALKTLRTERSKYENEQMKKSQKA